ncbi:hypothetical protein ACIHAA_24645 [Streptomyces sp. NPDC052040]|uniref:hypothetical protein n=1 Tax=Streptomyces sp. NPDC052040 TaxID=3365682 RepID=UPI0037D23758
MDTRSFTMRRANLITAGIVAAAVTAVAIGASESHGSPAPRTAPAVSPDDAFGTKPTRTNPGPTTESDIFKRWVAQEGTPPERAAVGHVTGLSAHTRHGRVDIHTEWNSRPADRYTPQAALVISAYQAWQTGTGDTLVTVYGADGRAITARHSH